LESLFFHACLSLPIRIAGNAAMECVEGVCAGLLSSYCSADLGKGDFPFFSEECLREECQKTSGAFGRFDIFL
jgi:hypothetical protein